MPCILLVINPRRACAARVTVVVVCVCVCVSLTMLSHISPLERLFILKTLSRTQRAPKVKNYVEFSQKPLRCRDPALPALYGYPLSAIFRYAVKRACASARAPLASRGHASWHGPAIARLHVYAPRVCTLVLFIHSFVVTVVVIVVAASAAS